MQNTTIDECDERHEHDESGEWEVVSCAELDGAVGGQQYSPIPGGRGNQEFVRNSYKRNGAIWGGLAGARGGPRGVWRGAKAGYKAGGRMYDRIHGPIN
jgi:hypothetical protein